MINQVETSKSGGIFATYEHGAEHRMSLCDACADRMGAEYLAPITFGSGYCDECLTYISDGEAL